MKTCRKRFCKSVLPPGITKKKINSIARSRQHAYASRTCWFGHRDINAFVGLKKVNKKRRKSRNDHCHAPYLQTKYQKSELSLWLQKWIMVIHHIYFKILSMITSFRESHTKIIRNIGMKYYKYLIRINVKMQSLNMLDS